MRLLMGNVGSSVIPAFLLALLMLWVLNNHGNSAGLLLWCAAVILSKLICYVHARRHLASDISFTHARRLAWELMLLNAVDGALWGALAWVTLDTSTTAGSILVVSVTAGIAGSSMSLLSPVLPVFVIFAFAELAAVASKVFLLGDPAYNALGVAGILFIATLLGQARNSYLAARVTIDLRFELADSHRRLREIEQRQMLAQERQRLMQDMHDGLGSSLVSALRVVEHGQMGEFEVAQVLKGCIDDLKLAIDSLEPVEADLLLLLATLRFRLGPRLESTGIALRWEVTSVPSLEWLNPKIALHILRILQEAFTNIIKHTQATEIRVTTPVDGSHVVVCIVDNGAGFSVADALRNGGKGLSNQQRRAQAIGAEVGWESSHAGSCFSLRLPIGKTVN
ncbi:ATP-binding protein [Rhodoferax sp.]|uniref:sensor histidine kinase n=1 Tax=Rhodoferax sp. TaxID=50421 RepID=UPI00341B1603